MANISFRWLLGLLFGIQSWLYAEGQDGMIERHVLVGQQVNLTCYLNSTEGVTWLYRLAENYFPDIYTCEYNQKGQCTSTNTESFWGIAYTDLNLQVTRSNDTSVLSLTITQLYENELYFKCKLGNNILQGYSVKSTDPRNIIPNCTVTSPHIDENGVGSITLSCEVNSGELDVNMTLEGIGLIVPDDAPVSSQSIKAKTLYFDDFNNVFNASCKAYFPDIDITRSCTYPNIIQVQFIVEGNDIIVDCDDESDVDHWRFYGPDGIEEDIENRSWIREGRRSLLIRNISERDVGKVVVCQTRGDNKTNKDTIGFTVISKMSGDNNKSNSEDPATVSSADNHYFVLTLLFLSLWLITTAVFGVWFGCRPRGSHEASTIPRTSDDEQTQTTPEYATVILSTSGENDLDTQGPSSGGLGLTGEEPEGGKKKSSRKDSETHYMDLSGNRVPTEYETLKSVTNESPRAENDVVPEGSNQGDFMSVGGTAMAKGHVKLEGSKANYMDMSGNHGPAEYETIKSLNYENPRAENDVVPEGSNQVDSGSAHGTAMSKGHVKLEGSKAYYMDMRGNHGRTDYEAMKSPTYANFYSM